MIVARYPKTSESDLMNLTYNNINLDLNRYGLLRGHKGCCLLPVGKKEEQRKSCLGGNLLQFLKSQKSQFFAIGDKHDY